MAFYTALHAVDFLLARDGVTVTSHETRNDVLQRTNKYTKIWANYFPLYNLSRTVRYIAEPARWIPFDQIQKNVFGRNLYPIEKSVQTLTGRQLRLDKISLANAT